jgi:dethiobiotin synthetase
MTSHTNSDLDCGICEIRSLSRNGTTSFTTIMILYSTEEAMTFLVDKVIHFRAQETNNDAIILQETSGQDNKYKFSCCW